MLLPRMDGVGTKTKERRNIETISVKHVILVAADVEFVQLGTALHLRLQQVNMM